MEKLPVDARPEKEHKGQNPNQKKAPGSSGNDRGRKDKESPKRHEEAPGRTTPPTRPAREESPHDEGHGRDGDGRNRDVERDRDSEVGVDEG